jgi:hypothetical protein
VLKYHVFESEDIKDGVMQVGNGQTNEKGRLEPSARAREKAGVNKMMRWASTALVSEVDDDGEWDDWDDWDDWGDWGECSSCNHWVITGTLCPICEDTGFINESIGVRRVCQARLGQDRAARMSWRQGVKVGV